MPIIIDEKSELGKLELRLSISDAFLKKGTDKELASHYLDIAYRPFIHKIATLIEYTIGTGDYDTIELLEEIITKIAEEKLKNG